MRWLDTRFVMYNCKFCTEIFEQFQQLAAHVTNVHRDKKSANIKSSLTKTLPRFLETFACSKCGKPFTVLMMINKTGTKQAFNSRTTRFCSHSCANSRIQSAEDS